MAKFNQLLVKYKKPILIVTTILMCIATVVGYKYGLFTDQSKMEIFLKKCGVFAPVMFAAIQAIQVVIPILPGAIGCLYGVIFWGPIYGFLLSYIGICAGSIWAFLIARHLGQDFVKQVTSKKFYDKYSKYLFQEKKFERVFAILIFSPVAPDDFLCYLAGISKMSLKKFIIIILLGKPFAIYIYSFVLHEIFQFIIDFISKNLS